MSEDLPPRGSHSGEYRQLIKSIKKLPQWHLYQLWLPDFKDRERYRSFLRHWAKQLNITVNRRGNSLYIRKN